MLNEKKLSVMSDNRLYDVIVGSETGILKGVSFKKNNWSNLNNFKEVDRNKEITSICWGNNDETEICAGLRDHTVAIYGADLQSKVLNVAGSGSADDVLIGISKSDGNIVTCSKLGFLKIWTADAQEQMTKNIGSDICCMRRNVQDDRLIATGGKENALKIWDLQQPDNAIFTAKNVRNDWLNLRVPVWDLDMCFIPDSKKIVSCTSYHQVRVYDQNVQKRPVLDMEFGEYPIKSVSVLRDKEQVVIGNANGQLALLDLRGTGKGRLVHKFKGSTGAIKAVQCFPFSDRVACCGLDRYLRIYDVQSKLLIHKFFLKARLNCLLLRSKNHLSLDGCAPTEIKVETEVAEEMPENMDTVWSKMDVVETNKLKRKSKADTARELKLAQEEHLDKINRQHKKKKTKH